MTDLAKAIGRRLAERVAFRALRHTAAQLDDSALRGMGIARTDIEAALAGVKPRHTGRCCGSAVCKFEAVPLR